MAQLGRALRSGRRGRGFKSHQPESEPGLDKEATMGVVFFRFGFTRQVLLLQLIGHQHMVAFGLGRVAKHLTRRSATHFRLRARRNAACRPPCFRITPDRVDPKAMNQPDRFAINKPPDILAASQRGILAEPASNFIDQRTRCPSSSASISWNTWASPDNYPSSGWRNLHTPRRRFPHSRL